MRRLAVALPLAVLLAAAPGSSAFAGAKQDRAALDRLDAAYKATSSLAAGPARTQQACKDAPQIRAAYDGLPTKKAPAGAPVDDETWLAPADQLSQQLDDLDKACKAPDHKITLLNQVRTADQVVGDVDELVRTVLDASKPRSVPAALKTFATTYRSMRPRGKSLCAQDGKLAKALASLKSPPAGADAARWQDALGKLSGSVDELHGFACGGHGADEEISGSLQQIHDRYYALILALPPT
jgi:hypothetical protein